MTMEMCGKTAPLSQSCQKDYSVMEKLITVTARSLK